jgi:hypothetical protein
MPSSGKPAASGTASPVLRLVVREIVPGDRRKFTATSNDVDTGGGARDLRFRPEDKFAPVFARMFPTTKTVTSRRGGAAVQLQVHTGQIRWPSVPTPGQAPLYQTGQAEIWPSTNARPGELRLVRVHEYGFSPLLPPLQVNGKTVMMLIQETQGVVVRFTTEASIRTNNWHRSIKPFLLRWLDSDSLSGFIDLQTGEEFPP